jgi:hypothetical protein
MAVVMPCGLCFIFSKPILIVKYLLPTLTVELLDVAIHVVSDAIFHDLSGLAEGAGMNSYRFNDSCLKLSP